MKRARKVLEDGADELVLAVRRDQIAVDETARIGPVKQGGHKRCPS